MTGAMEAEVLGRALELRPDAIDQARAELEWLERRLAGGDPAEWSGALPDLGHWVPETRDLIDRRDRVASWLAYLEDLAGGRDPGPPEPADPDRADRVAAEVLRAWLERERRPHHGLGLLIPRAERLAADVRERLEKVARNLDAFEEMYLAGRRAGRAYTLADLMDDARATRAEGERLEARAAALADAAGRFRATFSASVAEELGDVGAITHGVREVRTLAGTFAGGPDPEGQAHRDELDEVRARIALLGGPGRKRDALAARAGQLETALAARSKARRVAALAELTALVTAATAGDLRAWQEVTAAARSDPAAFPDRLYERLLDAAHEALIAGGAATFLEVLEGRGAG